MKKLLMIAALFVASLVSTAKAGGISVRVSEYRGRSSWSFGYRAYCPPQRVYYYPPVVYVQAPVVVEQPTVIYAPYEPTVYYSPVPATVYVPAPVYVAPQPCVEYRYYYSR